MRSGIKKWNHYLFEFLMLSLAVTLGFFVDNVREGRAERQLELQHMQSLISDLRQDTLRFSRQIEVADLVISMCDSIIQLLSKNERQAHDQQRLYLLSRAMSPKILPHFVNDRTFEEMRGSGALRLINTSSIADSISTYYFFSKELIWLNELVLTRFQQKVEMESKVFLADSYEKMLDKKTFAFRALSGNPPLATNDKALLNEFAVTIHYVSSVTAFKKNYLKRLKVNANRLLAILNQEYN
jgi:hypothetical protein